MFCEKDHSVIKNTQNEIMQIFLLSYFQVGQHTWFWCKAGKFWLAFYFIFSVLNEQKQLTKA